MSKLPKEILSQTAHFTWAGLATAAIIYSARSWQPTDPWFLRLAYSMLIGAGIANIAIIGVRESHQKRHHPDGILSNFPWLDATFFALGFSFFGAIALCLS